MKFSLAGDISDDVVTRMLMRCREHRSSIKIASVIVLQSSTFKILFGFHLLSIASVFHSAIPCIMDYSVHMLMR